MKTLLKSKGLAIALMLMGTVLASAQSKTSIAIISAGNEQEFGMNAGNIALNSNFSGTGSAITTSHSQSFSGFDDFGDPQTMSLTAEAYASAEYGILKASASSTIDNTFYSSSNNWYYDPNTGTTDPDGVPDYFLVAGSTSFNDTFTYTGLGAGFTVNFYYHIDGWLIGDDPYTNLIITNNGTQEIFNAVPDANGFVNQTFVTQKYTPVNGEIQHKAQFTSGVSSRVYEYSDGNNLNGTADFSSTVSFAGMTVYDQNGDVFTNWSVSSASGTTYPVPEPASMTILGAALVGLVAKKRKK